MEYIEVEVKYERIEKAWQINLDRIEEGWLHNDAICVATSRNQARSHLVEVARMENMKMHFGMDVTYENIPVVRYPAGDRYLFEGTPKTEREIDEILEGRKRIAEFNMIQNNPAITHCYIRKRGSYYRPGAAGYTDRLYRAGVFTKEEAIKDGMFCSELDIIPIDPIEHNRMLQKEIEDIQSRLFY
jgi:hypothetical protein